MSDNNTYETETIAVLAGGGILLLFTAINFSFVFNFLLLFVFVLTIHKLLKQKKLLKEY